ncbi:hypothetical protein PUNSTDRAFT_137643 [Punctularia strigosozonata HHB-11173 SS5]|uniref:uncharacterized protein n=1 Tax=Punctularia strigosozonata (strain HHB-11173) TaxID=741275 RepID=UPI000441791D|nr:uncharacterized protein PUNSTDRAFT_137643 [Punctularia strigosozonata HHB-11173 SS5]EIN05536.1 hypothetical protein PUNSTDRAFT_137643 [Punctularia strigosozonata HHB-11173 SS5]
MAGGLGVTLVAAEVAEDVLGNGGAGSSLSMIGSIVGGSGTRRVVVMFTDEGLNDIRAAGVEADKGGGKLSIFWAQGSEHGHGSKMAPAAAAALSLHATAPVLSEGLVVLPQGVTFWVLVEVLKDIGRGVEAVGRKKIPASQPVTRLVSKERADLRARLHTLEDANPTEAASASVASPQDEPMELPVEEQEMPKRPKRGGKGKGKGRASEAAWSSRVEVVVPPVHAAGAVLRSKMCSNTEVHSKVSAASSKTELSLPDLAPVKRAKHDEPASVVDEDDMWQPEVNTPCVQCKVAKKGCQLPIARGKATACCSCARSKKLCSFANAAPCAPTASAAPRAPTASAVIPRRQESRTTRPCHNEDNLWSEVMEVQQALCQGEQSNDHSYLLDEIEWIVGGSEEWVQDELANLRRQVEALTSQVAEFVEGSSRQGRSESEEGEAEEEEEGKESEE